MENLKLYPVLTDEIIENCGCNVEKYKFSYFSNDNEIELKQKGSSTVKLSDSLDLWDVNDEGLILRKKVSIAYPSQLYGSAGVACKDAEIGICIFWTNHKLTQTGCILPQSDVTTPLGRTCCFEYYFEPGMISGDLELSLCMYIKKKAETVYDGEESLMNEEGVSVGEIDNVFVDFENIYMEFPIEEYYSETEPLWWVEFSQWEDPKTLEDFGKENVCLYLNPYHQACPMTDGNIKNMDMLVEILSMTYLMIFQRLNEDDLKAARYNINVSPNTICSILHNFIETCNEEPLHFESPEKLLKSLQLNIRKKLTEGE